MPRSSRPVTASPEAPVAPKRRASARLSAGEPEVKRVRSNIGLPNRGAKSTTKKSKYFEPESSDNPGLESDASQGADSGSAYEEGKESSSDETEPEEPSESEDAKPKGSSRQSAGSAKGQELWREGVRAGLGPGKEVVIAKPKAREAGDTPYEDETLHPNTKLFLIDLAENNDREWMKAHDPDYRAAKKDFETFVESLTSKISEVDATVPELPPNDLVDTPNHVTMSPISPTCILDRPLTDVPRSSASTGMFASARIHFHTSGAYADSDQTHFSAAWSRTGKKGPYAAYYVHFQPGSCFVGCGLWNPEAEPLAMLREDIDEHADRWKEVLREPELRREFLKGASDDDDAVVNAFTHHNKESALKVKPKGYEANNENIKLLRLRSFTMGKPLADEDLAGSNAQEKIAALMAIMEPFVTYLNSVVMPDQ
ncbi:hypothetical protein N7508_004766 [Penicillium antarcticum]|uniref:uncharacterized protein n=1 Tax=Penicillium antarcticum TaxID=416450 RepID=UPI00239EA8E4|nr:uncharacterized protein N7508_004766 [Penicillium antarcticum]KAJ5305751.1 hypothetical protein N7508_004766 [Penicillium antarcticum]